jgi:hypothetical protein
MITKSDLIVPTGLRSASISGLRSASNTPDAVTYFKNVNIAPKNSATLQCDTCQTVHSIDSFGIDSHIYAQFSAIMQVTGWVCADCRKNVRLQLNSFKCSIKIWQVMLKKLKLDVTKIQQDFELAIKKPALTEWPSLDQLNEQKSNADCSTYRP